MNAIRKSKVLLTGAVASLALLIGIAFAVDSKLSQITTASTISITDQIVTVSGGTTDLLATPDLYLGLLTQTNNFRLSLQTATPVPTSDLVAQSTVYLTPYNGTAISIYDGTKWRLYLTSEKSVVLSGLTSAKNYDVFCYIKAGAPVIDLGPTWNAGAGAGSDTARGTGAGSTELILQDGVWVNKNAITTTINADAIAAKAGRFVGTIRTTGASTTEDSGTPATLSPKRFVFNAQNQCPRQVRRLEPAASWTYTTATWRQADGNAQNQVEVLNGLPGQMMIDMRIFQAYANSTAGQAASIAWGEDSTSAVVADSMMNYISNPSANFVNSGHTFISKSVPLGYHKYVWLEQSTAIGTGTFYGAQPTSSGGITGSVWN